MTVTAYQLAQPPVQTYILTSWRRRVCVPDCRLHLGADSLEEGVEVRQGAKAVALHKAQALDGRLAKGALHLHTALPVGGHGDDSEHLLVCHGRLEAQVDTHGGDLNVVGSGVGHESLHALPRASSHRLEAQVRGLGAASTRVHHHHARLH